MHEEIAECIFMEASTYLLPLSHEGIQRQLSLPPRDAHPLKRKEKTKVIPFIKIPIDDVAHHKSPIK